MFSSTLDMIDLATGATNRSRVWKLLVAMSRNTGR